MKCIPLNLISHQQMMVTRKTLKFLLDKFCASDELYHELSVFSESLPRSYLIKQKRNELTKLCHLERTPSQHPDGCTTFIFYKFTRSCKTIS